VTREKKKKNNKWGKEILKIKDRKKTVVKKIGL
jgi:hypothetical protein